MKQALGIFFLTLLAISCKHKHTHNGEHGHTHEKEHTHGHGNEKEHDHHHEGSHDKKGSIQTVHYEDEKNLKNIKQLTFGGDNAEAYFSFDNKNLVFQATNEKWGASCDQIYTMPVGGYKGEQPKLLSIGKGRTTCSYFMPGNLSIVYASTHLGNEACPESPRMVNGKKLVFSSNRNNGETRDTNVFIADWVEI